MPKALYIIALAFLSFNVFAEDDKSEDTLQVDRLEHITYLDGFGGNHLWHSYGYELRINLKNWMKLQVGTGLSMIFFSISETNSQLAISPNLSMQFGHRWIWAEAGLEGSILTQHPNQNNKSGSVFLAPRLGVHFKFDRRFEFGINYTPLFYKGNEPDTRNKYSFDKHWFSVRLRFIMISKKRRQELGKWKLNFK